MANLKRFIFKQFKTLSVLALLVGFSILLLMVRMKLTQSFFFLFLIWNLFLATVPFAITSYLSSLPKLGKPRLGFWFCVWLLLLPNAPYIITDLLHLKISGTHLLWLDILVVWCFALCGMLLFYLSIMDMKRILRPVLKAAVIDHIVIGVCFLSAFGVYLGRFLRYNSWEVISQPQQLFADVAKMALHPTEHAEAWLFALIFGTFLWVGHWVFCQFSIKD